MTEYYARQPAGVLGDLALGGDHDGVSFSTALQLCMTPALIADRFVDGHADALDVPPPFLVGMSIARAFFVDSAATSMPANAQCDDGVDDLVVCGSRPAGSRFTPDYARALFPHAGSFGTIYAHRSSITIFSKALITEF